MKTTAAAEEIGDVDGFRDEEIRQRHKFQAQGAGFDLFLSVRFEKTHCSRGIDNPLAFFGRRHSRKPGRSVSGCKVGLVEEISICSLFQKEAYKLCLPEDSRDVQWCVPDQGLLVYIRGALLDQDSGNVHISDHRGAVKRSHAEVVRLVCIRAAFKKSADRFRITFGPCRVRQGRFTPVRALRYISLVAQEIPNC